MTSGIDRLVNETASLRLEVERLRGEVVALRHMLADQGGELAALRVMLVAWPVAMPDNQPPVQH